MPQPASRSGAREPERSRLAPVVAPPPGRPTSTELKLLKQLEEIVRRGGSIAVDPPRRRYGFEGGTHLNYSAHLQQHLWRFRLTTTARDLLDHMVVTHDAAGVVTTTQVALATYFGCSQSKISKAFTQLSDHRFTWKVRRGKYQLNPTYAYRFSSAKHAALIARIKAAKKVEEYKIVVPGKRTS